MVAALVMAHGFEARADVTLGWNPSSGSAPITNYTLSWGISTGSYVFEANAGTQTSLTVTGLASNTVYYFVVAATDQNGAVSPDSNEIVCTNQPAVLPSNPSGTNGSTGGGTTNSSNPGGSGSGGSSGGSGSTGEVSIPGVPPVLTLSFTNHHPLLSITGTAGSTLMIQSITNAASLSAWTTITNLAMTNPSAGAPSNSSTINLAFVPAAQNYEVIDTTPPASEFYQAVMPYDYMVLADSVLSGQGYTNRLVLVRMPGISSDDVCYVTPQSSFLFYDTTNQAFELEPSSSTIRQIATTLSTSLGQNWTSASEFAYSNGVSTILATVVETEPASSDPVAGASTPSIQIDF
jgi:chitodextrinase